MKKEEFLDNLRRKISYLPKEEQEERLAFYAEMIDDRIEEGMTEEEATAAVGTVDGISSHIMSEIPLSTFVLHKVKPKKEFSVGKLVLLILLFPLWFPLLITVFSLGLSFFIVLWSFVLAFFCIDLALIVAAVASFPGSVFFFIKGKPAVAVFSLGAGFILAGIAILFFHVSCGVAKGIAKLMKKFFLWIKSLFVGKEEGKCVNVKLL